MSDKPACVKCDAVGDKYKVYLGRASSTLLYGTNENFYDEEGRLHYHPVNRTDQQFSCSNGHHWEAKIKNSCVHCDWTSE